MSMTLHWMFRFPRFERARVPILKVKYSQVLIFLFEISALNSISTNVSSYTSEKYKL